MSLLELFDQRAWIADAACRGTDPNLFFPARGASTREAKAICADCPVRQECADDALNSGWKHGIWGGLSEYDRRKARRARRSQP